MADNTPFLDVLSDSQRAMVARSSRGEGRPSYYDSTAAQGGSDGYTQISQDLEAVLILAPRAAKKEILSFIQTAIQIASSMNADDFVLMTEVVAVRKGSYTQIASDIGSKILPFDAAKAKLQQFIEVAARSGGSGAEAVTAVILPDLGVFFASLLDAYSVLSTPDDLAVHDRISDAGILHVMQNAATERATELASWSAIFQMYLSPRSALG
jgi:hypothetical protein